MSPGSYRPGWTAVAATVGVSFVLCAWRVGPTPTSPARAAQSLEQSPLPLGGFTLTDSTGTTVTDRDTANDIWIAAFIFTRCPSSCPRVSAAMKGLQTKLAGTGVRLASISVDPEHDTPEVLARYARGIGADPKRWRFLTGTKSDVYRLIFDRFHLSVSPATPEEQARGAEEIVHSTRLALVDQGNRVVGYFDSDSAGEVGALVLRARALDNFWGHELPTLNAALNGTCALVLLVGWFLIRRNHVGAHRVAMFVALGLSAVFLTSYLTYHFLVVRGSVPFQGIGKAVRVTYFTILLSHTLLAVAMVPLVALTVVSALRGKYERHTRWSKVTFPIWLYVSITGVVVYVMLYRMDFSGVAAAS